MKRSPEASAVLTAVLEASAVLAALRGFGGTGKGGRSGVFRGKDGSYTSFRFEGGDGGDYSNMIEHRRNVLARPILPSNKALQKRKRNGVLGREMQIP